MIFCIVCIFPKHFIAALIFRRTAKAVYFLSAVIYRVRRNGRKESKGRYFQ